MAKDKSRDPPAGKGGELSFDPATWLKGEPDKVSVSSPKPADDDPSFNPKTWAGATDSSVSAPPTSDSFDPKRWRPDKPRRGGESLSDDDGPHRRLLLAGGGAVALLVAGGAAALLRRGAIRTPGASAETPSLRAGETSYDVQDVQGLEGFRARLVNYGVSPVQAAVATDYLRSVAGGNPGNMRLTIRLSGEAKPVLTWAEARRVADGLAFRLVRRGESFEAFALKADLAPILVSHPRLQITRDGLYTSAVGDLDPALLTDFAAAMAFDFDFAAEVREGDQFEVVHEEMRDRRGHPVGRPKLLFAFMSAGGKDRYLYRFKPPGGEEEWFDDRGRSNRRAFMRTPLDGARITSLFGVRTHPVFHDVRMHKGVDFGCKVGTHVFAAADGVVEYAGPATGFGTLLKLKHAGGLETWYGHLSGFPGDIRVGEHVEQGKLVAFSGNIGFSTGPHLHYETHKDGVAVDPQLFLDAQEASTGGEVSSLTGAAMESFLTFRNRIDQVRRSEA